MKKLIILGILFRVVLMSITAHFDFWFEIISGYLWHQKGVVNIYEYFILLPYPESILEGFKNVFFPYPPLIVFTFGLWTKIIAPFTQESFFGVLTQNLPLIYSYPELIWHIFLYKVIYLIFDIGLLFLLPKFFINTFQKRASQLLWIFNPASIYALAQGNFDLLPLFFTVASLYVYQNKKYFKSAFLLGMGIGFKIFPVLFLPLMIARLYKNKILFVKMTILALGPLMATAFPYWMLAGFHPLQVLTESSSGLLISRISLTPTVSVPIVLTLVITLYLWFYFYGQKVEQWRSWLVILLILFSFTDFHMQWFVWLTPFLIIEQVINKFRHVELPILLLSCWLVLLTLNTADLHLGLLVPLKSLKWFSEVPPLVTRDISPAFTEVVPGIDFNLQLKVYARSLFLATSIIYSFLVLKEKNLVKKSIFK